MSQLPDKTERRSPRRFGRGRDYFLRNAGVFFLGVLGLYAASALHSVVASLALFTAFSLAVIVSSNQEKNFLHPLVAFTLFYYPYSTWHAYYSLIQKINDLNDLMLSVHLAYIGLLAFYAAGVLCLPKPTGQPAPPRISLPGNPLAEKLVMGCCLLLIAYSLHAVAGAGHVSKREIFDSERILVMVMGFSFWVLTAAGLLVVVRWRFAGVRPDRWIFIALLFAVLAYLVVGERDYMFRIIICVAFIFFDHKRKANLLLLLCLLFAVAVALPFAQEYKAAWVAERIGGAAAERGDVFMGEFYGASRNLYVLVSRGHDANWSFLGNDFLRGLIPFGGKLELQSSTAWFNQVYRLEEGIGGTSGWGLGLVAEGSLIGGIPGIILVMAFVSAMVSLFYKMRVRSEYWYVFYLLSLSTAIYCIRADLANVLSMTYKVGGAAVLMLYLLGRFRRFGRASGKWKKRSV